MNAVIAMRKVSVSAGTVLHRSYVPLIKSFLVFYLAMNDKCDIFAVKH